MHKEFDKLDESPVLNEIVKKAISEAFEKISSHYELHAVKIEEVECRSRDGFISSNDGGWNAQGFSDIQALTGSGRISNLPEAAREKIQEFEKLNYGYALDAFKSNYKDQLEKLNLSDEDLTYHKLYDKGHGELAEKLSELESENNSDEQSSIMFQIECFLSRGSEDGVRTMNLAIVVNWEAPYHRAGKNNEWFIQDTFDFDNEFTLKSQINLKLKELTGHLVS